MTLGQPLGRKKRALLSVALLFSGLLSVTATQANEALKKQPNVLLIMVDDLRVALGAMGDSRAITPNIDKLADQGMLFNRAYTNVPVCGASRASLMTSIYPHKTRFVTYYSSAEKEVPKAVNIGEFFKESGYYTVSNGKIFHNSKDSDSKSWSEPAWVPKAQAMAWYDESSKQHTKKNGRGGERGPWVESAEQPDDVYYDGQVKNKTVKDLKRLAAQNQPFFLAAGFFRPHLPFNSPKKYFDLYKDTEFSPSKYRDRPVDAPHFLQGSGEIKNYSFKNIKYNSDEFHRESLLGYYAAVSFVDQQVGDILSTLDDLGIRDNTLVVLTSDHGFNLGEHNFWSKHNMLHTALQIPLIVDIPGDKGIGKTDALVSLVDLFPSLIELSHLTPTAEVRQQMVGKSFAPILFEPTAQHKEFIYSRFTQGDTLLNEHLVYTEYKNKKGENMAMLFDLKRDPNETKNVVSEAQYQSAIEQMSAKLKRIKAKSEARNWDE